jgi:hypothetical protein
MTLRSRFAQSKFAGWQFAELALLFFLFLLVMPRLPDGFVLTSVASLFLLNLLLVANTTSATMISLRWIGWTLWTVTTLCSLVELVQLNSVQQFTTKFVGISAHALLIMVGAISILSVVFRAGRVTIDGIFASVVTYQMIGLFFAQVYTLMMLVDPNALHLPDSIPENTQNFRAELIYFSFVTLATLGYGDIVPDTSTARSVAIIEAIIGQFYVAVVVALLVSSFLAQKLEEAAARSKGSK